MDLQIQSNNGQFQNNLFTEFPNYKYGSDGDSLSHSNDESSSSSISDKSSLISLCLVNQLRVLLERCDIEEFKKSQKSNRKLNKKSTKVTKSHIKKRLFSVHKKKAIKELFYCSNNFISAVSGHKPTKLFEEEKCHFRCIIEDIPQNINNSDEQEVPWWNW